MADVTIRDVAQEAGLSVSSVSRILRGGQGHVYPTETHERVREIAERLGYRANAAARLLRQSTRTLIGMCVHYTEHPHLNRFLVAVRDGLIQHGYDPVVFEAQQLSGTDNGQSFPPPHMLAGLINLGTGLEYDWPQQYADLHRNMPIVAVQAVSRAAAAQIDVVHVDYKDAFLQAIHHVKDLGHQHIAYFGPASEITPIDLYKFKAWKTAAAQTGLNPGYMIPWNVGVTKPKKSSQLDLLMSESKIQQTVMAAVAQWDNLKPRPTAIICASDEVAICLQSYLLAKGWNLPQDLSIMGYDGITFGALVFPPLTTVEPNYEQMASSAIDCLLRHLTPTPDDDDKSPRQIFIPPKLIMRGSTAPPRTA